MKFNAQSSLLPAAC